MLATTILDHGALLVGVFSGVTRDAGLLEGYENALDDDRLRAEHSEIYVFAPGARMLVSFSAYQKAAEMSAAALGESTHPLKTAFVGSEADVSANIEIYTREVLGDGNTHEHTGQFHTLEAALAWLGKLHLLDDVLALMPPIFSPPDHHPSETSNLHYADLHDILNHAPLVLTEYWVNDEGSPEFLYVSEAAINILGEHADVLVSDPESLLVRVHEHDRSVLLAQL